MDPVLPAEQWRPAVPALRSTTADRSPDLYKQVAAQFDVERTPRYQPDGRHTFCNCYTWDTTSAMGAEIPHWIDLHGAPTVMGHGAELSANATVDWLVSKGGNYGWTECDEAAARANANAGKPTVAVWANPIPGHSGHVAMVLPGDPNIAGTVIAQAGAHNYFGVPLSRGFGTIRPRFFLHA